jgi:endonuclease/exonuclease/phosphatase family metal-dependent hydrolase
MVSCVRDTHYWPLAKVQLKDGERSFIVKKRLDHIVVSPSFLIESADVFDDRLCGSDHLLVLAKLRLNKK